VPAHGRHVEEEARGQVGQSQRAVLAQAGQHDDGGAVDRVVVLCLLDALDHLEQDRGEVHARGRLI
jgi:hypothetical protein